MNTTTALLLPLSTRALASIHILAATTAAFAGGGGASHSSFGYAAGGGGGAGALDNNICYPTAALSSSHISSNPLPQQPQPHYQSPFQHQHSYGYYHHDYSNNNGNGNGGPAEWLFSINALYLLLAPLLLRELPAMMATLDPLIDYLFDGPSSWLAFPGWCAELWSLFAEEKRNIVQRRRSYDELDALRLGGNKGGAGNVGLRPGDGLGPPRRRTW